MDGGIGKRLVKVGSHLLADAASLALFWVLGTAVTAAVSDASQVRTQAILGAYLAYCAGLLGIRVADGRSQPSLGFRAGLASHGLLFGIFVSYLAVPESHPTGIWSIGSWGTGDLSWTAYGGLILWFGVVLLCPLALLVPLRSDRMPLGTFRQPVEFVSLLAMNLMAIVVSSRWTALFAGSEPYENLAWGGRIIIFALLLAFFLLFFAHPAFYRLRTGGRLSLLTYCIQCSVFVWSTAQGAWA